MAPALTIYIWNGGEDTNTQLKTEGDFSITTDRHGELEMTNHSNLLPQNLGDWTTFTPDETGKVKVDGKEVDELTLAKDKGGVFIRR